MEKYNLENDLTVFGVQVKTFPLGIGEAFESLIKMFPAEDKRSYYGICYMGNNGLVYNATAEEKYTGEAEKYNCEKYIIKKGGYLTETLHNWRSKTGSIKDIFQQMMQDSRASHTNPIVEWYKNNDEMLCMIKHK